MADPPHVQGQSGTIMVRFITTYLGDTAGQTPRINQLVHEQPARQPAPVRPNPRIIQKMGLGNHNAQSAHGHSCSAFVELLLKRRRPRSEG